MPIEDVLRDVFEQDAGTQPAPIALPERALASGRRVRRRRRAGQAAGAGGAVAALAVAVAGLSGGLGPGTAGPAGGARSPSPAPAPRPSARPTPTQSVPPGVRPWWQTWAKDRAFGRRPDAAFMARVDPGNGVQVYASGTLPDGEEFVMYLDRHDGHAVQYIQGWGSRPDFGEGSGSVTPAMNDYIIQLASTAAVHSASSNNSTWAIVVARPGTTKIEYSVAGGSRRPMTIRHGIGLLLRPSGTPGRTVALWLYDRSGLYAAGLYQQFAPPLAGHSSSPAHHPGRAKQPKPSQAPGAAA